MAILVTGGSGYIGSHTCIALLEAGYELVVVDNLSNSSEESLYRVQAITGKNLTFVECDLQDRRGLELVFESHPVEAVIHFAALKAVGESVSKPLLYYQNNIAGTLNLLAVMQQYGVRDFIFSSSATVYGDPETVPIKEGAKTGPTNPYGETKLMIENMLRDVAATGDGWRVALLRYFNPVGAHVSGQIGEDPQGIPNNLVPYIAKVAVGELEQLSVFGDDYPTPDGTGVRDYIHVVDLAAGHVKALQWLQQQSTVDEKPCCDIFNLGTGRGYSVLEVVKAFEVASGNPVPYQILERRAGDIAECYADASKAKKVLSWAAEKNLSEMMEDTWRWQRNNPKGFT